MQNYIIHLYIWKNTKYKWKYIKWKNNKQTYNEGGYLNFPPSQGKPLQSKQKSLPLTLIILTQMSC